MAMNAQMKPVAASRLFLMCLRVIVVVRPEARVIGASRRRP